MKKNIDFWEDVDKHILYFRDCCSKISQLKDIQRARSELNGMYQYLKDITPNYFKGNELSSCYKYLKQSLLLCEYSLPKDYIIESTPDFQIGMMSNKRPKHKDITDVLDWIVYQTRKYLYSKNSRNDFLSSDLANECKRASNKVQSLCKILGIPSEQLIIYPGFSVYPELYEGSGYHYINIIYYGNDKYIIDCTYRQFFTTTYNNLNRIGIIDISGCRAGVFMTMTEDRKSLAETILKKGWFQATPNNIKNYFDGFALSYRNGLYYDLTNDYSYTTKYSSQDYMNFIKGRDSQINHESLETLGYQRTLKPVDKNVINF